MNGIVLQDITERAAQLGDEHGKAQGSWAIDGNTSKEHCENIIRGYDDGDPEVSDMCPSPLSGEWADSMTPTALMRACGVEPDDREWADTDVSGSLCDAYESAFTGAWWETVLKAARYQVEG
jgi:hypothetical protein